MTTNNDKHIYKKNKILFIWAASLTLGFALIEIIYGFISGSLMIVGDGIHMSSDAISLILSLIATIIATKAITKTKTFGYKRFEPIAAFINGLTLVIIPIFIIYEAFNRLINPVDIIPNQMLIVGIIGLSINAIVGFILSRAHSNLNVKSALLHVVADLITSISVVIGALAIIYFEWVWVDPIGSIITSIIIISGGIKITKQSFHILMEGTPEGYSVDLIMDTIKKNYENVVIDDIKLWCINESEVHTLIRIKFETVDDKNIHNEIKEHIAKEYNILSKNIYIDLI